MGGQLAQDIKPQQPPQLLRKVLRKDYGTALWV